MADIRPLTDADVDAVAVVHVRSWQAAYAGIIPAATLAAMDPADRAARMRARAPGPAERTLVAVEDGVVTGFAMVGPDRDDDGPGELYAIYVDPDRWGGGTGHALLTAATAELAAAGFRTVRLWVLQQNHRARRFYERAGFAPDGARQMYRPRNSTVDVPEIRYATRL